MQAAPPMFHTQQMYMSPTFQPPPPPPPPPFLGTAAFSPQQQSFSFGASSTSTPTTVASSMAVNTAMSEIPAVLPRAPMLSSNWSGSLGKEQTISTMARKASPTSSSSMNEKVAVSDARNELEIPKRLVAQAESGVNSRDRARSGKMDRGGRGGSFLGKGQMLQRVEVSEVQHSIQSMRFSDVCKDRIAVD